MITKQVYKFDAEGFLAEPLVMEIPENIEEAIVLGLPHDPETGEFSVPPVPYDCTELHPTPGLYRPKFDGMQWQEGATPEEIAELNPAHADWEQLQARLRGTPLFGKAMLTSAVNAWSLLLFALGTSRNVDDLLFALSVVRAGMPEDFSQTETEELNAILADCGFEISLS
ncbi:hypothetical protein NIES2135_05080 [Leptolyngbya boryana NIES-2135]|jgi:hypothetical protein|uniref:Uncharacterized protein n=1 Tax=Leptolyngbya boryana NIES-2135 TaxID=1973484 RepID=A0A1Z4JAK1_LEPBY|nr:MULTISPECIES: hypothetical protein [Leptolyngbya]BAY53698.1 hypothetical protein NIES2135_05080 [Leptolyngbya boryana NIES-2135]MBD1854557.1 hypothetical protein [Leptolyngbya sp. FACHB-1624]MBD2367863.1 hypothetical protein [Leptolyngbya sp. FACHB-161]MBD2374289.1 hypothetical protein [Leptolyngbya sp. FACHB-238]MBD2398511.1 hypothetical protein [Leptolyngbya sp. FACHB-239]